MRKTDHGNGIGNGIGKSRWLRKMENARLLSIHSMVLDVGNYAKVKRNIIFIGDGAMWIGDNARWLNDRWILRWYGYSHMNGNIIAQVTLKRFTLILHWHE